MSQDSLQSVYRERLLEHLLIGELLKYSWLHHNAELEVSQPAVDRAGHDVVLEANGIVRHVQLKSSSVTAATRNQLVHLHLAGKPSGCVIWTRFDAKLNFDSFLFYGGAAGEPLSDLSGFATAKHTKGDANGVKKERPNLRVVPMSKFSPINGVSALYGTLFGYETAAPLPTS